MRVIDRSVSLCKEYGFGYLIEYILVRAGLKKEMGYWYRNQSKYEKMDFSEIEERVKRWYWFNTGRELNLEKPELYTEKLQWLKLYDCTPEKVLLADKYLVRNWVKEKIGETYLVPLLGVWDKPEEIDFAKLPDRYVLKCNHGSHMNIIVNEKNPLNYKKAIRLLHRWMDTDYAFEEGTCEIQYSEIPRRIIAEEYMENFNGEMYDYKFFCFDGKVKFIMFLADRNEGLRMANYDRNWNRLDFYYCTPLEKDIAKPKNLKEMIEIAETLAEGFCHVRVDLYRLNDGTIKFGEMTFTSASGIMNWEPKGTDLMLGQYITLPKKKFIPDIYRSDV